MALRNSAMIWRRRHDPIAGPVINLSTLHTAGWMDPTCAAQFLGVVPRDNQQVAQ